MGRLTTRILDIVVVMLMAAVVVLPRPDAHVQQALAADATDRDRVAELQTTLLAAPAEAGPALELADIFLDSQHPDWALAALSAPLAAHPDDHRLHSRRSLALAQFFAAAPAYVSAARALELCRAGSAAPCGEGERTRLELLVSTLDRVKDLDMRTDPNTAKDRIIKALRPAYVPPARAR
jgi:hypothetical protein